MTRCGKQTKPRELWKIKITNPSIDHTGVVGWFGLVAAENVLRLPVKTKVPEQNV